MFVLHVQPMSVRYVWPKVSQINLLAPSHVLPPSVNVLTSFVCVLIGLFSESRMPGEAHWAVYKRARPSVSSECRLR